jgi:D-galactarolactone cycloisomerase
LRVEAVDVFAVRVKTDAKLVAGPFAYPSYQTVLVRVECDGKVGWGEAMTRISLGATTSILKEYFVPLLRDLRFEAPAEAWRSLWRALRVRGQTRGVAVEALSAIELALWDCYGKLRGRPLRDLLSGESRDTVPCYAGSIFESRGSLEGQAAVVESLGINKVKVKVGFGVERDRALLSRFRKIWPGGLIADANGAYDRDEALAAAEAFRSFDLSWFEEPAPGDDHDTYLELARHHYVPVGAGETWFVEDFTRPIQERLVDVVQPSVSRCGGVGVAWEVSRLSARHGIAFSPMVGMNSSISLAASIQLASASSNAAEVEYDPFGNPLVEGLTPGFPELKSGRLVVGRGEGLGVDVDMAFLRKHLVEHSSTRYG